MAGNRARDDGADGAICGGHAPQFGDGSSIAPAHALQELALTDSRVARDRDRVPVIAQNSAELLQHFDCRRFRAAHGPPFHLSL
ncbi:hypothetical protein EMEDMD4_500112 [Sinorhizobium medicae]|uniref:Uncharacterized protein n=1 Tax=Sinorhizobium medicae TaxID=110321 RepID=A0A508X1W9_9HYPH|nr:hypothetical protein EMEDMD4_500112 [Sinorhizobium medicae]